MATRPSSRPPESSRTRSRGRLLAAVSFAMLLVVVVYVIRAQNDRGHVGDPRRPFDPTLTNRDELRRATEAISRVIAAPRDEHEAAVETLETLRVESPGARDLQESCVNTYRPPLRAAQIQVQLRSLLLLPDGGERPSGSLAPSEVPRVQTLIQQAEDQVELAHSSEDRCYTLYGAAVQLLHLTPAQRPEPPR